MFCSNCGNQLADDAKFCSSCGTPVAAQNPVYTASSAETSESQNSLYAASEEPIYTTSNGESDANSQTCYSNQPFNQAPVQNDAPQQAYGNSQMYNGGVQPQPVYQNPVNMPPDNSQNWGPLMPPKKKSKAPIIITLSVLALLIVIAVVVCCLIFCGGGKGGAKSATAAIESTLDASSKNDSEAVIDTLYPLYGTMFESMLKADGKNADDIQDYRDYVIENIMNDLNPVDGKFTYSDLKVEDKETMETDDLEEFNSMYNELDEQFSSLDLDVDLGDKDDYKIEAGVIYEGTVKISANGETEVLDFEASVVKCNGEWYVIELELY